MNKSDIILISVILVIVSLIFTFFKLTQNKNVSNALVYYDNELVLKIDLNKKISNYKVKGFNGDISITAGDAKIKVDTESSPLHLCSKQGFISKSYETIVCLPNKIVIKLEEDSNLDVVAK